MKLDADKLNTLEAAAIAAGRGDAWERLMAAKCGGGLPFDFMYAFLAFTEEDWSELRRLADAMNAGGGE